MSDDDTLLLLRRKPRDGLSRVHSQLRRSLRAAGSDAMRVTDEMVEAALGAIRHVTGGAFTPSGLLLREAIEAALDAAPPCEYIRSTGEGTHHCALATAPDDKLREAARMALEALGQDNPAGRTATIAALRAALEGKE